MYDEVILDRAVQIAAKNGWDGDIERSGYAPLVYNHDFCKALWGEKWEHHIQQMVLAPDPVKYLSDNMP